MWGRLLPLLLVALACDPVLGLPPALDGGVVSSAGLEKTVSELQAAVVQDNAEMRQLRNTVREMSGLVKKLTKAKSGVSLVGVSEGEVVNETAANSTTSNDTAACVTDSSRLVDEIQSSNTKNVCDWDNNPINAIFATYQVNALRCPSTCECVTNCNSSCPDYTVDAKNALVCFNDDTFDAEVTTCKAVFNEAQQIMLAIQGWGGVFQSLAILLTTRYPAVAKPETPFKVLVTDQVLRSSFFLMGLQGGFIAVIRSTYMYLMSECSNKLNRTVRNTARFYPLLPFACAFTLMGIILLLDASLQRRLQKKNVKLEMGKADYKMNRRLASEQWYDRSGASELELWDNMFDRLQPSREFIDQSTKSFLLTHNGRLANKFQLASAVSVVFGSFMCATSLHYGIRGDRNSIPGRNTLLFISIPVTVVALITMMYYEYHCVKMTHPSHLRDLYDSQCHKHVPDVDAVSLYEHRLPEHVDAADQLQPGVNYSVSRKVPPSPTPVALTLLEESPASGKRSAPRVKAQDEDEEELGPGDSMTLENLAASIMSLLQVEQVEGEDYAYPNPTSDERGRCLKWRLCAAAEGKPMPRNEHLEYGKRILGKFKRQSTDRTQAPVNTKTGAATGDGVLERYAACWAYSKLNPNPAQLWHVPIEPPNYDNADPIAK